MTPPVQPHPLAPHVPLLTLFAALLGACFGSFLNVCIHRIPRGMSVVRPRSHCTSCGRLIPWHLNIPLLSWPLLGGRCRYCRAPIAFRYFLVELLAATLFLLVWLKYASAVLDPALAALWHPPVSLLDPPARGGLLGVAPVTDARLVPVYWLAVFGLLLGAFVDLEHFILPNRVTIGGMALGLLISPLVPLLHGTEDSLTALARAAAGCATGFGTLWLVAAAGSLVFRKEAMGFGDVKLMGAVGAFLGWQAVFFTVVVSSLFGSVAGIALIVAGKRRLQSRIPYGPFIAAAALVWIIWGPVLVNIYLRLLRGA